MFPYSQYVLHSGHSITMFWWLVLFFFSRQCHRGFCGLPQGSIACPSLQYGWDPGAMIGTLEPNHLYFYPGHFTVLFVLKKRKKCVFNSSHLFNRLQRKKFISFLAACIGDRLVLSFASAAIIPLNAQIN